MSIYGEEVQRSEVLEGLEAASGFFRGELGRRLQMRRAPEVHFHLDRGIEKGTSVLNLLEQLEQQRETLEEVQSKSDQPTTYETTTFNKT